MLAAGMVFTSCNRADDRRNDSAARQVGRDAYRASDELKRGAKKVEQDVRKAGKDRARHCGRRARAGSERRVPILQ